MINDTTMPSTNETQALSMDESGDQKMATDEFIEDYSNTSNKREQPDDEPDDKEKGGSTVLEQPSSTTTTTRSKSVAVRSTECLCFLCLPSPPYPDDDDFDENNAAVPHVLNEWAQGTSIHGVPFVTDARTWKFWKRFCWIVLVVLSSVFMIWQVTTLIEHYRQYDVSTSIHTVNPSSLVFPQVTVCNTNMFSKARMEKYGIPDPSETAELEKLLTPLDEFVVKTWFNGIELNTSQVWEPTLVSHFGRCWTFRTDKHVRRPGFIGGLKLWADLQQWDYENHTESAGAVFFTEQPGTFVAAQLDFNAARPGKETFIALQSTHFHRERDDPWSHCHGEAPYYTPVRCRATCSFAAIRERCGCRMYSDSFDPSFPICRQRVNPTEHACVLQTLDEEEENGSSDCDCSKPACSNTNYAGSVSEVDFSDVFLNNFDYNGHGIDQDYLLKNFLSVTINFGNIQYDRFTETKSMTFAELLGSIGGSMGFFLGISLLSIFELVGDLGMMRLVPRLFGHKHLFGLGARQKQD